MHGDMAEAAAPQARGRNVAGPDTEDADFGPLNGFLPGGAQSHQLYGVLDWAGPLEVEAGVGFGLTAGSDGMTLKLILSKDLN